MRFESLRPRLEPFLLRVERPGRYLGLERNVVRKDLSASELTLCLAFPDAYEIGMSHTGTKVLYELVNRRDGWTCERAYAPWVDLEEVMRRERIPALLDRVVRAGRGLRRPRLSLQSELNYTNVPNMLDLAGVPVLASERGDADPVVVGGGPCVANPEPVADFFDAFLLGDAEEALGVFLERLRRRGASRAASGCSRSRPARHLRPLALRRPLRRRPGRLVRPERAGRPERAKRVWVEKLDPSVYPEKPMVPSVDIVQDRLGLEIMRGCTQGCRFCQAGYWYRPVRELDPADVARMTKAFIDEAGWSEVGLLSLSSADYSQIEPLVACLAPSSRRRRSPSRSRRSAPRRSRSRSPTPSPR
jgi:Fe-S oxidoreductase